MCQEDSAGSWTQRQMLHAEQAHLNDLLVKDTPTGLKPSQSSNNKVQNTRGVLVMLETRQTMAGEEMRRWCESITYEEVFCLTKRTRWRPLMCQVTGCVWLLMSCLTISPSSLSTDVDWS